MSRYLDVDYITEAMGQRTSVCFWSHWLLKNLRNKTFTMWWSTPDAEFWCLSDLLVSYRGGQESKAEPSLTRSGRWEVSRSRFCVLSACFFYSVFSVMRLKPCLLCWIGSSFCFTSVEKRLINLQKCNILAASAHLFSIFYFSLHSHITMY